MRAAISTGRRYEATIAIDRSAAAAIPARIALAACAALLALVLDANPCPAADLVLSGSTTVQARILEPLAADIKAATGISITVEGIGSGNGLKRLIAGEVPAAIISAELKALLLQANVPDDGTYRQHLVLEDVIVPVVNAKNQLNELSWDQLRGLFTGTVKNWKEVGGADLAVRIVTSHPESATREVVWEVVMGKKDFHRSARIVYATKKELVLVAESAGAVGAVSQGFVDQYVREAQQNGDEVEVKVIKTKRISRPLALVTKGEPDAQVAKLLAFLRTEQAIAKFK